MLGGDLSFAASDGVPLLGYLARPNASGRFPAVMICQENQGLTEHFKDVARRFAKEGYVALALDILSRQGGTEAVPQNMRGAGLTGPGAAEQQVKDYQDTMAYLRRQPYVIADRIGMIGYCLGGLVTYNVMAAEPTLRAAAPYYGPLPGGGDPLRNTKAATLVVFGANDNLTNNIPAIEAALGAAGVPYRVNVYPDAPHAFFNDTRPSLPNNGYVEFRRRWRRGGTRSCGLRPTCAARRCRRRAMDRARKTGPVRKTQRARRSRRRSNGPGGVSSAARGAAARRPAWMVRAARGRYRTNAAFRARPPRGLAPPTPRRAGSPRRTTVPRTPAPRRRAPAGRRRTRPAAGALPVRTGRPGGPVQRPVVRLHRGPEPLGRAEVRGSGAVHHHGPRGGKEGILRRLPGRLASEAETEQADPVGVDPGLVRQIDRRALEVREAFGFGVVRGEEPDAVGRRHGRRAAGAGQRVHEQSGVAVLGQPARHPAQELGRAVLACADDDTGTRRPLRWTCQVPLDQRAVPPDRLDHLCPRAQDTSAAGGRHQPRRPREVAPHFGPVAPHPLHHRPPPRRRRAARGPRPTLRPRRGPDPICGATADTGAHSTPRFGPGELGQPLGLVRRGLRRRGLVALRPPAQRPEPQAPGDPPGASGSTPGVGALPRPASSG